jgi:multimeric flavodoxin WrbA
MNDLPKENRRRELKLFFENLMYFIEEGLTTSKLYKPVKESNFKYKLLEKDKFVDTAKKIIIITDAENEDNNLNEMIDKFKSCLKNSVEVININEVDIKGHCLGCCKCALENKCVYDNKDGYRKFLDYIIKNGDIIIFAGTIKDRYLSSRLKLYFDRSFCYNHVPILKGKQIGYIISGKLSENENLRQILEFDTQGGNLVGFVTDEAENNAEIDNQILTFANMCVNYSEKNYFKPESFLNIASKKLFADAIDGQLGSIFLVDYKYYKKNGIIKKVSFQEKLQAKVMRYFMGREKFGKEIQRNMIDLMITSHKKTLEIDGGMNNE